MASARAALRRLTEDGALSPRRLPGWKAKRVRAFHLFHPTLAPLNRFNPAFFSLVSHNECTVYRFFYSRRVSWSLSYIVLRRFHFRYRPPGVRVVCAVLRGSSGYGGISWREGGSSAQTCEERSDHGSSRVSIASLSSQSLIRDLRASEAAGVWAGRPLLSFCTQLSATSLGRRLASSLV